MIKQDSILDRAWLLDLEGRTQEAIELYEKSARNGNTEAMCMLGMMYYGKDPEKSIAWYEKAADLDSVDAIENLSYIYRHGIGVEKSVEKSAEYERQLAELHAHKICNFDDFHLEACCNDEHYRGYIVGVDGYERKSASGPFQHGLEYFSNEVDARALDVMVSIPEIDQTIIIDIHQTLKDWCKGRLRASALMNVLAMKGESVTVRFNEDGEAFLNRDFFERIIK